MHTGRLSYTKLDPLRIRCAKRRRYVRWFARLYYAEPAWADRNKMRAVYRKAKAMRQKGQRVQGDHTVPLFHPRVCGLHNEFNLQILSEVQNATKSNHTWPDDANAPGELFPETLGVEQYALPL